MALLHCCTAASYSAVASGVYQKWSQVLFSAAPSLASLSSTMGACTVHAMYSIPKCGSRKHAIFGYMGHKRCKLITNYAHFIFRRRFQSRNWHPSFLIIVVYCTACHLYVYKCVTKKTMYAYNSVKRKTTYVYNSVTSQKRTYTFSCLSHYCT